MLASLLEPIPCNPHDDDDNGACTVKTVSVADLRALGACEAQVELFAETFGEGDVPITEANVLAALRKELSVPWLLPVSVRRSYQEAAAPAWRVYVAAIDPAWEAYVKVAEGAGLGGAFTTRGDNAWKKFVETGGRARKAYQEAVAPILARFLAGLDLSR